MYSIFADSICIYNDVSPHEGLNAESPTLELAESSAGSLRITIPKGNAGYKYIETLKTDIVVKKYGREIWAGRVLAEEKDFYNNRVLYCEGELAFLNDTEQPRGEYHNITVRGFLELLISNHNSKVAINRRFKVGEVTVTDPNDSLYRFTNRETTWECIQSKLLDKLGGIIRVRKEANVRYIDYLADYPRINTQVIRFGDNLLDLKKSWDLTDFATVILPLGCHLEETDIEQLDAYLTVELVNDDSFKIVVDKAPLEINTTGTKLSDYIIYGSTDGVGDYDSVSGKYKIPVTVTGYNLFNKDEPNLTNLYPYIGTGVAKYSSTRWSIILEVEPNTSYVMSKLHQTTGSSVRIAGYPSTPVYNMEPDFLDETAETSSGSEKDVQVFTTGANTHYILCFLRSDDDQAKLSEAVNSLVIEKGTSPSGTSPYRRNTYTILVDAPLTRDESVSLSQSHVDVETGLGYNFITIDTENAPDKIMMQYLTDETKEYVQSADAVKEFGWIEKTVRWDDITTPIRLLNKARRYLTDTQFSEKVIELKAVDLNYPDGTYEAISLLDKVRVISSPHGMDRYFPVTKLEIPLNSPESTVYTLGNADKTGISSVTNRGGELSSVNVTDVRTDGCRTFTGQRSFVTGVTANQDGTYSFDISTYSIKNGMFVL